MITTLDQGINKFKALSFAYAKPEEPLSVPAKSHGMPEEEYESEGAIEKRLMKSKDLREKLYKEKREMGGKAPGEGKANTANNMSYFLREIERPKRKEGLRGVRTYSYQDGARKLRLTSASILLFEMNKLST